MTPRLTKEDLLNSDRPITADEFERMPQSSERYELIDGKIREKPMPVFDHSDISHLIDHAYTRFDPDEKIGIMRTEVRMKTVRGNFLVPDMSFWIASRRPVRGVLTPAAPDLAIELQSPDQSFKELTDKVPDYLASGVRLVWIIGIIKRTVSVFRPGQAEPQIILSDGTLDGEDLIPGFRLSVANLFG